MKRNDARSDPSNADRVPAAVLFGDMKGSTPAGEADELRSVKVLREYLALIESTVKQFSPQLFKVKGESDGFLARLANAHVMVDCGMALRDAFRQRDWKVRLGGSLVEAFEQRDDDLLGADMNRAARIAAAADADTCQFLVADSVPPVVRARLPGIAFHDHGPIEAKGVDGGLVTFEVVRTGEQSERERERAAYLDAVARTHEWIDLGGLAPQVGTELLRIGLDAVFIHLSARRSAPRVERFEREEVRVRTVGEMHAASPRDRETWLRRLPDHGYREEGDFVPTERVSSTALTEQSLNVVLGHPGSGKTTLLRYIARRVALGQTLEGTDTPLSGLWANLTPVYVRIGEFASYLERNPGASLEEFIPTGAGPYVTPMKLAFWEAERRLCRSLFLFDGLDEIVDSRLRQQVRDRVSKFVAESPGCPVVVTSRIVGYRDAPMASGDSSYAHFTLAPFNDDDITRFLGRWYDAIEHSGQVTDATRQNARTLAEGIQRNASVRRLATNPLLLTLIALIYWREVKLPRRRIELYRAAAVTLLDKWRQAGLDVRESTTILMAVAFEMHSTSSVGLITAPELERLVVELKMDPRRGGRSEIDAQREAQQFLWRVSTQSGLLHPRGEDERGFELYGFLHLTFEEYFAARELARRWKQGQLRLRDYLHLTRWREILLLASAHLSDEDDEEASNRFVKEILDAQSPFEVHLQRDLLLAANCLADDAVVYADVKERIFVGLADAFTTTIVPLSQAITDALAAMAGSRCAPHALRLAIGGLRHRHPWVRRAAAHALGGFPGATPDVLATLLPLLRDENHDVRRAAAYALDRLAGARATPDALAALLPLMLHENHYVRWAAGYALGRLAGARATPEILAALLPLLRHENHYVRLAVTSALGAMGKAGATPEIVAALLPLLREKDNVRLAAASALGRMGKATPEVLAALLPLLRREKYRVRSAAASALGAMGEAGATPEILAALLTLLRDENDKLRWAAAYALGGLGEAGATPEVLAALLPLLRDDSDKLRWATAKALGARGAEAAVPEILEALAAAIGKSADEGTSSGNAAYHSLLSLAEYSAEM